MCGLAVATVSQLRGEGAWFVSSRGCLVTSQSRRHVNMNFLPPDYSHAV